MAHASFTNPNDKQLKVVHKTHTLRLHQNLKCDFLLSSVMQYLFFLPKQTCVHVYMSAYMCMCVYQCIDLFLCNLAAF